MNSLTNEKPGLLKINLLKTNVFNTKKVLIKFDRICAWALVGLMLLFFISGYGETKGIISPAFAKFLHETLLPIPGAVAFAFHSAYGMHVGLKRWRIWNRAWSVALVIYVMALVAGIIIFQFVLRAADGTVTVPQSIDL